MAQAVRSYGEAGMRVKLHAPKQPLQNGPSGKIKQKTDAAAKPGSEQPAATTGSQEDGAKGELAGCSSELCHSTDSVSSPPVCDLRCI